MFMAILSTIFLAVVFLTTLSLKRTDYNKRKIMATHFAEEADEWLRGEKETSWTTFTSRSPGTYCMNTDISACDTAGTCWDNNTACLTTDYSLDGIYKRWMTLSDNGTRVDVTITVEWLDGPNTFSVPVSTTYSRWE